MRASPDDSMRTWFFAELVIGAYCFVTHMERLRLANIGQTTSELSLRASRMVVDTIIEHHSLAKETRHRGLSLYWMAFYPFHAQFTLYYNILEMPNSEGAKADIQRLEMYGAVTQDVSRSRFEYVPIAKAIESLNRISRYVYEARQSRTSTPVWSTTPLHGDMMPIVPMNSASLERTQQMSAQDQELMSSADFMHFFPAFDGYQPENSEQFRNMVNAEHFEPVTYMQQIENQFVGTHANYGNWWETYNTPT